MWSLGQFFFLPLFFVWFKCYSWVQEHKFAVWEVLMGNYTLALPGLLLAIYLLECTGTHCVISC